MRTCCKEGLAGMDTPWYEPRSTSQNMYQNEKCAGERSDPIDRAVKGVQVAVRDASGSFVG